jgi:hypothetical protein
MTVQAKKRAPLTSRQRRPGRIREEAAPAGLGGNKLGPLQEPARNQGEPDYLRILPEICST